MPYSTASQAKEILGLTGSSYDTELSNIISDVDGQIDEYLRIHTSVPLSTVPSEIAKISAKWAAGEFQSRRSPPGTQGYGHPWIEEARKRLVRYIESNYLQGTFKPTGGLKSGE